MAWQRLQSGTPESLGNMKEGVNSVFLYFLQLFLLINTSPVNIVHESNEINDTKIQLFNYVLEKFLFLAEKNEFYRLFTERFCKIIKIF